MSGQKKKHDGESDVSGIICFKTAPYYSSLRSRIFYPHNDPYCRRTLSTGPQVSVHSKRSAAKTATFKILTCRVFGYLLLLHTTSNVSGNDKLFKKSAKFNQFKYCNSLTNSNIVTV